MVNVFWNWNLQSSFTWSLYKKCHWHIDIPVPVLLQEICRHMELLTRWQSVRPTGKSWVRILAGILEILFIRVCRCHLLIDVIFHFNFCLHFAVKKDVGGIWCFNLVNDHYAKLNKRYWSLNSKKDLFSLIWKTWTAWEMKRNWMFLILFIFLLKKWTYSSFKHTFTLN